MNQAEPERIIKMNVHLTGKELTEMVIEQIKSQASIIEQLASDIKNNNPFMREMEKLNEESIDQMDLRGTAHELKLNQMPPKDGETK